jgi:hypothetical protein
MRQASKGAMQKKEVRLDIAGRIDQTPLPSRREISCTALFRFLHYKRPLGLSGYQTRQQGTQNERT